MMKKIIFIILIFISIALCFVTPLLVEYIVSVPSGKGDWLSFWGSYLGIIPSGLIAYFIAKYQIDKDREAEQKEKRSEHLPYFYFDRNKLKFYSKNNDVPLFNVLVKMHNSEFNQKIYYLLDEEAECVGFLIGYSTIILKIGDNFFNKGIVEDGKLRSVCLNDGPYVDVSGKFDLRLSYSEVDDLHYFFDIVVDEEGILKPKLSVELPDKNEKTLNAWNKFSSIMTPEIGLNMDIPEPLYDYTIAIIEANLINGDKVYAVITPHLSVGHFLEVTKDELEPYGSFGDSKSIEHAMIFLMCNGFDKRLKK